MENIKLGKYSVKVLDSKILVFQDVIEDPEGLIDYYEKNVEWDGWHGFGTQSKEHATRLFSDEFPTEEQYAADLMDRVPENPYRNKIYKNFYELSKLYTEYTGIKLKNWSTGQWSVAKYIPDVNHINNEFKSMGHHTDYQQDRYGQPGEKFGITSVFYPNDDYEGGEISFRVLNLKNFSVEKEINYKPKKGEVIFFPSTEPYYHGVLRIWGKPKYIMRLYWLWNDEGKDGWHDLRRKHGNEAFEQMEKDRIRRFDLSVYEPVQRPLLTFKEYYEMLENGTLPPFIDNGEHETLVALRNKKLSEGFEPYEL
jgi:hypothetical protein